MCAPPAEVCALADIARGGMQFLSLLVGSLQTVRVGYKVQYITTREFGS